MAGLSGHVALITGGARGQGRAHAIALARAGADIVVVDIAGQVASAPYPLGTMEELTETAHLVEHEDRRCIAIQADTRDTLQMQAAVETAVAEFGRLDILIAQAAICSFAPFHEISDQQWDEMLGCDLTGTFKAMRAVVPQMRRQDYGRIVATSSMGGRQGLPNMAHYSAAKFGVIGLVKSLAAELASTSITVNAVCPSNVNTTMGNHPYLWPLFFPDRDDPTAEEMLAALASTNVQPVPNAEPEDIAELALFLVGSEAGRFITGSVFDVGMGKTVQMP